ncbi:MAG: GNAT family N-acetyltransferase [Desulfobacteraceae bacterium]|nr:GNAT family N-acetyltransferase [Desulfobacteraceae bacterium]
MMIHPFRKQDIGPFLRLAEAENWVAESWELEFLLAEFSEGCFAARTADGRTAGFVTSLRHGRSGWIGNLIVSPEHRGQGIGEKLFANARDALRAAGVETVWLTASKAGQPLYEKFGFNRIDTIIRWKGTGRQRHAEHGAGAPGDNPVPVLDDIDGRAWGDRRAALLSATASRGELISRDAGFIVVQPCGDARQIGPFAAPDDATADILLKDALHTISLGTRVFLDAPASNRSALRLFNRRRMHISGSNVLMYSGVKPAYRPEYIYGLATMGSCG